MLRVLVPLVAALQLEAAARSPVEKVVELIEELKAKIEADGASEQKIYDKYACWCETTTQRKADNIDEGKAVIGRTTTFILVKKGAIATLATEIAELEAKIAKNNAAMKTLTSIREKENSDYQQEKSEMETALSSLHSAIEVLNGAGTGGDDGTREGSRDASMLQKLGVVSKVRTAILASPQMLELSDKKSALLKTFLEDPSSFLQGAGDDVDYYDKKAQAKSSYSPASATVTGILKDMYETFASNLEKANTEESSLQKAFEDLMAEKTEQNRVDREAATKKEGEKAEKSQQLADAEQKLEDTKAQLAEDEEFFETARQQCKDKSDSWDERKRLRTEELDGINKALDILTSDESRTAFATAENTRAQDTFGEVATRDEGSFVQLSEEGAPRERAYRALKHAVG